MNLIQSFLQSQSLQRTRRYWGKKTGLYLRLKRFTASASADLRTTMLVKSREIDHVIDVGANTGQFAESLYDFGYTGKVISFEPVSAAYAKLVKRSLRYPNWTVAGRCALGDIDGETEIYVSDDSVFSSILKIKDSYVSHNPKSRIVAKEKIPVYRIDSIIDQYLTGSDARILLKVDTQGYEKQVLAGAIALMPGIQGLKLEIPLYAIYRDSTFLFYEIIDYTRALGFHPYSFNVEGVDLNSGRVNTIDGLFFRSSA